VPPNTQRGWRNSLLLQVYFIVFKSQTEMSLNFKWSGDPISVDVEDKQLTSKPKTYYA
jgi:hypothetical protein